jgi:hypothetical protein
MQKSASGTIVSIQCTGIYVPGPQNEAVATRYTYPFPKML